jgi:hypothetical protein
LSDDGLQTRPRAQTILPQARLEKISGRGLRTDLFATRNTVSCLPAYAARSDLHEPRGVRTAKRSSRAAWVRTGGQSGSYRHHPKESTRYDMTPIGTLESWVSWASSYRQYGVEVPVAQGLDAFRIGIVSALRIGDTMAWKGLVLVGGIVSANSKPMRWSCHAS